MPGLYRLGLRQTLCDIHINLSQWQNLPGDNTGSNWFVLTAFSVVSLESGPERLESGPA